MPRKYCPETPSSRAYDRPQLCRPSTGRSVSDLAFNEDPTGQGNAYERARPSPSAAQLKAKSPSETKRFIAEADLCGRTILAAIR